MENYTNLNEVFGIDGTMFLSEEENIEYFQRPSPVGAGLPKTEEHKENIRKGILNSDRKHIYEANRLRMLGTSPSKETRKRIGDSCRKRYQVTYDDGRTEIISGIGKWCKKNKYSTSGIYYLMKGEWKKHKDLVAIEELSKTP